MDSDSGEVDVCGGNLIGAGGSRNKKGLNPYKHDAADKRKARQDLPPQDDLPQVPPLRVFADGSQLLFDWCRIHPTLLCHIFCQITDICWALVLGGILQFVFNKDRGHINRHKEFDIDGFAKKVKFGYKQSEHVKNAGASSMAKPKTFMLKGSFLSVGDASPQTIIRLMETKGPVGLTLDLTAPLESLTDGIYRVPKPKDGIKRHAVTIVAHGLTLEREIFFEVKNTWGTNWGVDGYGRIIISGTTDDVFYLDEILEK
ncbi:hypothetical protein N665_1021s0025 [Sinapis alba]|nr:hypothetical protein N665_1021s0025 [Sinapis alba]